MVIQSTQWEQTVIRLPQHPFWEAFQRFGKDEVLAMAINIVATLIVVYLMQENNTLSTTMQHLIIALSGPVIEKIGFFPIHFWEAYQQYKTTAPKQRLPLWYYIHTALHNSSKSLVQDIIFHDPLYAIIMFLGLQIYPQTPVRLLAGSSFAVAIVLVAMIDVLYIELLYKRRTYTFRQKGFEKDQYYEARILIENSISMKDILIALDMQFNLPDHQIREYTDKYYQTTLPIYAGRKPLVRIRTRHRKDSDNDVLQSAQIVYTKANEIQTTTEQYRYFPVYKQKFYHTFHTQADIEHIPHSQTKKLLRQVVTNKIPMTVNFTRSVVRDPEGLLASADSITIGDDVFHVIELKVRTDTILLLQAIRYILYNFPVVQQTTHSKHELVAMRDL